MTDMFSTYGASAAPERRSPDPDRYRKAPSALEKKLEEKQRLSARYKALKRIERIEILQTEPRLLNFMRYLRSVGPSESDDLLVAIKNSWLMTASRSVRGFALSRIARRSDKIRLMLGLTPLDDPLPPETSVFFEARNILGPV